MSRILIAVFAGCCLIFIAAGCGTADLATAPASNAGAAANATSTVVTTPTSPNGTPSAISDEVMAQSTLDYTREHGAIISGEPQVVLSRSATPAEVTQLGYGQWIFQAGCVVPMYIVILKGDLDARSVLPDAALPPDQKIPVKYLVYVYDMNLTRIIATYGDPTGAVVKKALGDPTLPDGTSGGTGNPVFGSPDSPLPCNPVQFPDPNGNYVSTPPSH
jgi:hypothetical protein